MQRVADISRRQQLVDELCQEVHQRRERILQEGTDDVEGQVEHEAHDDDERRDRRMPAGQDLVDLRRANRLPALMRLRHAATAHALDKVETHIRDGGGTIEPTLLLHLDDDVLHHLLLVLRERQRFLDPCIPLDQLRRRKSYRDAGCDRVILDQVHDAMNTAVNRAAVVVLRTEVEPLWLLLIARDVQRMSHQLIDAFIFRRRNRHDRYAEVTLHAVDVDGAAIALQLVHHVEGDHHRDVQLDQLHGEIEVSFNVGGIDDIDDAFRSVVQDKLTGDDLLARVRRHRVDARQIRDLRFRMALDGAGLPVHRDAWEITDVLVRARQLVKERRLSAVLIARQREAELRILRKRMFARLIMETTALTEARVLIIIEELSVLRCFCRIELCLRRRVLLLLPELMLLMLLRRDRPRLNLRRIRETKGQLIVMDPQLHRVAHRCKLHELHLRPRNHAHIQEMLSKRTLASDRRHDGALADVKIL